MQARSMLMAGAVSAGLAFGTAGTAAAHAIQYPVGVLTNTAHGLGVAALLPCVMAFNAPACTSELGEIAVALGATQQDPSELAEEAIERVRRLCAAVGIPRTLAELGLKADQLDWVAQHQCCRRA